MTHSYKQHIMTLKAQIQHLDTKLWFRPETMMDRHIWTIEKRVLPPGKHHVAPHAMFYVCRSLWGYSVRQRGFERVMWSAGTWGVKDSGYTEADCKRACEVAIDYAQKYRGVAEA